MHDRNHEGYHDPTAATAVRRVMRGQGRKMTGLTYRIGETRCFRSAAAGLSGRYAHEQ